MLSTFASRSRQRGIAAGGARGLRLGGSLLLSFPPMTTGSPRGELRCSAPFPILQRLTIQCGLIGDRGCLDKAPWSACVARLEPNRSERDCTQRPIRDDGHGAVLRDHGASRPTMARLALSSRSPAAPSAGGRLRDACQSWAPASTSLPAARRYAVAVSRAMRQIQLRSSASRRVTAPRHEPVSAAAVVVKVPVQAVSVSAPEGFF